MFTKLYLSTTNPTLTLSEMISKNMYPLFVSIIGHTMVYMLFANTLCYIFTDKILSSTINTKLFMFLYLIMMVGYVARFYHVKEIYNAYNRNMEKTRTHLDKLYIGWIFIA